MVGNFSLDDKRNQESLGFRSSLALVNSSFMKGKTAHQEGCKLPQERFTT
jgi:hypothetical protein